MSAIYDQESDTPRRRPWQDAVFFAGSLIFVAALVPAVLSGDGPPLATCLLTAGPLLVFAGTYATMKFWLAAGVTLLTALLWIILAAQT